MFVPLVSGVLSFSTINIIFLIDEYDSELDCISN
jgi:hypothetical protein